MRCSELVTYGSEHCEKDKAPTQGCFPSIMMHFIQSGKGYFNGRKLSAGQGFISMCGAPVEYHPDKEEPWFYAWVNFVDHAMLEEIRTVFLLDEDMVFSFDTKKPYIYMIESSYTNYGKDIPPSKEKALHDLREISYSGTALWYSLLSLAASDKKCGRIADKKSIQEQYVQKVKMRLNASLATPNISIEELARGLNISRSYLRNLFYSQCGMSPQAYMIQQRMERACHFLASSTAPVNEIAVSVGYSDALYFSKLFHKHMGMSPLAYRKKLQAERNAANFDISAPI